MIGTTLSHYEITAELGRGGMGIVYKARDTKLDREVAIKVLPSAALASADDRERFYREAKSAAALNHPNIAQVYQIDEAVPSDAPHGTQPSPFIAMEYIAGGTLQDKIKEAPLKLSDAVKIASQVAEALKAAHAKNIVHRDIKSANVMITEDGIAKVLDFGLAKTNQSTMLTRMGSTLGTVAYMSPEQARGQEVDGRTDLYSLGTMLYEMVAGRLPFAGEYEQAVVYSILNEPPEPLTSLRTGVPMDLERLVNKLLAKDAEYRYQSAAGLLSDLKSLDLSGSGHSRQAMPVPGDSGARVRTQPNHNNWTWVGAALLIGLTFGSGLVWFIRSDQDMPKQPAVAFSMSADQEAYIANRPEQTLAISPDGSLIAQSYLETGIQIRRVENIESSTLIPNTTGAVDLTFSPDNSWLFYVDRNDYRMYKMNVAGGPPRSLATLEVGSRRIGGSHWASDGFIYFGWRAAPSNRISEFENSIARIPEDGGQIEVLHGLELGEGVVANVHVLPGNRHILYTQGQIGENWSEAEIRVLDLNTGQTKHVLSGGSDPVYLPTGHLVYFSNNVLFAAPFDLAAVEVSGSEVPVLDEVWASPVSAANPSYAVSNNGTMIKLRGVSTGSTSQGVVPMWVYPDGRMTTISEDRYSYSSVDLSPDGSMALLTVGGVFSVPNNQLWLLDTTRGTRELLREGGIYPVWHPNGEEFVFADETGRRILKSSVDNPSVSDTLLVLDRPVEPSDWSSDGSTLILNVGELLSTDVYTYDIASQKLEAFRQSGGDDDYGQLSPDGQWIAYESGVAPEIGVVIQRYPEGSGRFEAVGGGSKVRWAPDGRSIFTILPNGQLAEFNVDPTGQKVETPRYWGEVLTDGNLHFDVDPTGERALILARNKPEGDSSFGFEPAFDVIINWFSTLPEIE